MRIGVAGERREGNETHGDERAPLLLATVVRSPIHHRLTQALEGYARDRPQLGHIFGVDRARGDQ
jgi:hypothetical protein